jgi:twitching motility two-component system response regulator PilH
MSINTVLLVDDMADQLAQIKAIVSSKGLQTITAQSGKEALVKAKESKPDLIFMDVVMPEMDGFATCRELKSDSATKDIPVIFVSSKDQEADKVWAQMQGSKAYITKPYNAEEIIKHLN